VSLIDGAYAASIRAFWSRGLLLLETRYCFANSSQRRYNFRIHPLDERRDMTIVVSGETAKQRRRSVHIKDYTQSQNSDAAFHATLYMGAAPATAEHALDAVGSRSEPQAYLVEQPAYATVPPHFHDTDQFQVFVDGVADFGKQRIAGLSVHYAGGHTPYGPIVTADEGAHYFTLRVAWDSGGKPMPESRALLKRGQQCHRMADISEDVASGRDEILPVEADGLGAVHYKMAPGSTDSLSLDVGGAGQYALVLDGDVELDGDTIGKHSCVFRFPEDAPLTLTAGNAGASVLLMQFPVKV